jgi:hypothetical protein
MSHKLSLPIALVAVIAPTLGQAIELAEGRLQIHGFASQAVVATSANRYYGNSPDTSLEFTELGLNLSYQLDPNWLFSGQLLARRAGEMYDGSPSLDYALVDYAFLSDAERRLGLRVGRIKHPLGLYNETRDVPFTRPGIFLPQVIYYDKVRNLLLSSDGAMLYGDLFGPQGNLSLTLSAGQAVIDDNVEWSYLGEDFDGDLESDSVGWKTASLWYSTPADELKLGLSAILMEMSFDAGAASPLDAGSIEGVDWIASFQYNAKDWTLSAEYARTPTRWDDFGPLFPYTDQVMEGYYLQGAYRVRPDLEVMARYEEGFADRGDRSGRERSALTGGVVPRYDFFSKIFTLGLRWDIAQNLMLRLEYQRHDGTFALSWRENPDPGDLVREWDVFAASISTRF